MTLLYRCTINMKIFLLSLCLALLLNKLGRHVVSMLSDDSNFLHQIKHPHKPLCSPFFISSKTYPMHWVVVATDIQCYWSVVFAVRYILNMHDRLQERVIYYHNLIILTVAGNKVF